jgi:hypothetical protein
MLLPESVRTLVSVSVVVLPSVSTESVFVSESTAVVVSVTVSE